MPHSLIDPTPRPLGISDAFSELDTQLSTAADQIGNLYSRLAPILYPAPPDVAQLAQSDPYAESSTYAMIIANKAAIVRDLNFQLTDILKRISL